MVVSLCTVIPLWDQVCRIERQPAGKYQGCEAKLLAQAPGVIVAAHKAGEPENVPVFAVGLPFLSRLGFAVRGEWQPRRTDGTIAQRHRPRSRQIILLVFLLRRRRTTPVSDVTHCWLKQMSSKCLLPPGRKSYRHERQSHFHSPYEDHMLDLHTTSVTRCPV